jgi:hypothetical protein
MVSSAITKNSSPDPLIAERPPVAIDATAELAIGLVLEQTLAGRGVLGRNIARQQQGRGRDDYRGHRCSPRKFVAGNDIDGRHDASCTRFRRNVSDATLRHVASWGDRNSP